MKASHVAPPVELELEPVAPSLELVPTSVAELEEPELVSVPCVPLVPLLPSPVDPDDVLVVSAGGRHNPWIARSPPFEQTVSEGQSSGR